MQAAADLVAASAKLTAGVQDGHDHFQGREAGALVMFLYGDTASVVFYSDGTISVDRNLDRVGIARHDFVNAIIDDFLNQVMQAALVVTADIHTSAHASRLKAFQNPDVLLTIIPIPVAFRTPPPIPPLLLHRV